MIIEHVQNALWTQPIPKFTLTKMVHVIPIQAIRNEHRKNFIIMELDDQDLTLLISKIKNKESNRD